MHLRGRGGICTVALSGRFQTHVLGCGERRMSSPDDALIRFRAIAQEFAVFCSSHGRVSETDTRVKFIDRVLKEVCCWPEAMISREDRVDSGYADYCLAVRGRPLIVVEAKREGDAFVFPTDPARRSLKLNGALMTEASVRAAIEQVRAYCDDRGVRYAVATNGYAWIAFRAVRDDMPWREGRAKIFPTKDYILSQFTEFWNLLSYDAICAGSLDTEFGSAFASSRQMYRVVERLFNADLPLRRNRLSTQLQPIVKHIFEDIAEQNDLDLLKSCYVHSESLRVAANDLDVVITDAIPRFVQEEGGTEVEQSESDAGAFGVAVAQSFSASRGALYLLLGGIGSGKTTFLRRYERLLAHDLLAHKAFWFHLDFLKAPELGGLELFVWRHVLEDIRSRYASLGLEERRYLKKVFKDKLTALDATVLRGIQKHTDAYEQAIAPYLYGWQGDIQDYVPRLLKFAGYARQRNVVIFVDNVDQLNPSYQAQIFLLAQRITRIVGSTTIVALREEAYYAASIQRTFTAYTSHKFHIASPRFRAMIGNRINYAIDLLQRKPGQVTITWLHGQQFEREDICQFLRIIQSSIFEWSKRITLFIEAVCFGNMRMALQMFTTFLTSGATDVGKMLLIYRRGQGYTVAFHEFIRSIMLGERQYYKEDQSPILNVFNCTGEKNSSHFTARRVLAALLEHRGETSSEGRGYVELARLVGAFGDIFDNERDLTTTLDRLLAKQLIEANTRSTESVVGSSHVRITSAGWYYARFLVERFVYLDLVLQDTPLNDAGLEKFFRESVYHVNNLAGKDEEKVTRVRARLGRVERFLEYLDSEEASERDHFGLEMVQGPLAVSFAGRMIDVFKKDREYLEKRLAAGRPEGVLEEAETSGGVDIDLDAEIAKMARERRAFRY